MTLLDRALAALYLEVPEAVARDLGKIVHDAIASAHSSGIARGREEAAKWHDERAAHYRAESDKSENTLGVRNTSTMIADNHLRYASAIRAGGVT